MTYMKSGKGGFRIEPSDISKACKESLKTSLMDETAISKEIITGAL